MKLNLIAFFGRNYRTCISGVLSVTRYKEDGPPDTRQISTVMYHILDFFCFLADYGDQEIVLIELGTNYPAVDQYLLGRKLSGNGGIAGNLSPKSMLMLIIFFFFGGSNNNGSCEFRNANDAEAV